MEPAKVWELHESNISLLGNVKTISGIASRLTNLKGNFLLHLQLAGKKKQNKVSRFNRRPLIYIKI